MLSIIELSKIFHFLSSNPEIINKKVDFDQSSLISFLDNILKNKKVDVNKLCLIIRSANNLQLIDNYKYQFTKDIDLKKYIKNLSPVLKERNSSLVINNPLNYFYVDSYNKQDKDKISNTVFFVAFLNRAITNNWINKRDISKFTLEEKSKIINILKEERIKISFNIKINNFTYRFDTTSGGNSVDHKGNLHSKCFGRHIHFSRENINNQTGNCSRKHIKLIFK